MLRGCLKTQAKPRGPGEPRSSKAGYDLKLLAPDGRGGIDGFTSRRLRTPDQAKSMGRFLDRPSTAEHVEEMRGRPLVPLWSAAAIMGLDFLGPFPGMAGGTWLPVGTNPTPLWFPTTLTQSAVAAVRGECNPINPGKGQRLMRPSEPRPGHHFFAGALQRRLVDGPTDPSVGRYSVPRQVRFASSSIS